jgi:hypothetical protein
MYPAYNGTFTALGSDDIAGIRAIYSGGNGRSPDQYDSVLSNGSFLTATAVVVSPTSLTAQLNADITTTMDCDYYVFTAPLGSASTATISVQSAGLSQLSPKIYVYNALHTQIAFKSGVGQYGTTLTVTPSITALGTYYVKVAGADLTAFSTGAYALTINTGSGSSPPVTPPNTQVADGNPEVSGGGQALVTDVDLAHGFDRFFAAGDPATPSSGSVSAALAVSLGQVQSFRMPALVLAPNMTAADISFQAGAFQAPPSTQSGRPTAAWPDYGAAGEQVSDWVFGNMGTSDVDGGDITLPF